MQKSLQTSEWVLVGSLIILLASLCVVSSFHDHRKNDQYKIYEERVVRPIEIDISGAVSKPGKYLVQPGTPLSAAIKKSRPKKFADMKPFDLKMPVVAPIQIVVPELEYIQVRVTGAVTNPIDLQLPRETRLCELRSKIQLTKDADSKYMKRRRLLKDGETIVVPEVKEKSGIEKSAGVNQAENSENRIKT